MPVVGLNAYPTIATISGLARSMVRDDMAGATNTLGEGQILVDNIGISVTMANFFNSAVRTTCRKLRLAQAPMLIVDNAIIFGIPPMYGQASDPSIQVYVGFAGYFDGVAMHANYALPAGCFQVIRCWEREYQSNDIFHDMGEPSNGLPSLNQTNGWGAWEWRQDRINLPGSLDQRDLRMRYEMLLQPQFVAGVNPATTYLPILDCEETIATEIVRLYSIRQGGTMTEVATGHAGTAVGSLTAEQISRQQGTNYVTLGYGSECGPLLNNGQ